MAIIKLVDCSRQFFLKFKKCYKVSGHLSISDVNNVNRLPYKVILILDNTKEQDPDIIRKFDSDKVKFSVLGGLDYFNKKKYNKTTYIKRTMYSPGELSSIITYFERIERKIKPSWTTLEKSMFVYKMLTEDLHYKYDYEDDCENGKDIVRSLSGLLYKRLVCAGFALVYKEAMDRIGVPCLYQNLTNQHSWNILKIEGEYRAIELTWECYNKQNNECEFRYFNQSMSFYENVHHNIIHEREEIMYKIVPFSKDKVAQHKKRITLPLFESCPLTAMHTNNSGDVKYIEIKNTNSLIRVFLTVFGNQIVPVHLPTGLDPKYVLTQANIIESISNNFCIGNVKMPSNYPKSNLYQRHDGSTFVIRRSGRSFKTSSDEIMYEFDYFEVSSTGEIRRATIFSENRLDLEYKVMRKTIIANNLLSSDRLRRKINKYNGYIGFIGNDSEMYYNQDFEQIDLNIYNRK